MVDGFERIEAIVVGHVQGVGFRVFVARAARQAELTGWVRNTDGGALEVVAEGPSASIDDLLDALRVGPAGAAVRDVRVSRRPAIGDLGPFRIAAGGHGGD